MKLLFSILFFFFPGLADSSKKLFVGYECRTMAIFAEGDEVISDLIIEAEFQIPLRNAGGHGGFEKSFQNSRQSLLVTADATWMTIEWSIDGKLVAKVVNVQTNFETEDRALIAFHPENDQMQAWLNCTRIQPKIPF